ncbi:tachylectin-related carbohydrate-binding protein [Streptomyces sp. JH34]|uniref:aggregation-promoting factor C-terminal-like domain-containing protein n=1 Tax=Streptomyces sp. JH34 TaxID=2793633 RepID=UPI0023FA483B|nr:tachylectin-related carbohydrate-binding protein [Streptomyces sp. JH34]MDF6021177.1 peptidase S1 and S6 [Streptomyces sp. JH34]
MTESAGRIMGVLLAGAVSLSLLTASTGTAQAAEQVCTGTSSIYGILDDGRLTYSAITPGTGNRIRTRVGPDLGFEPKAMATLNFNTILVTSTAGALYRVDVQTNDETLAVSAIDKIIDKGWTHDKLSYDGYGHLYGTTADGTLLQYLVSQAKPKGVEHIGQRAEIGTGFVLKTLTTVGQDRLIATTEAGKLFSYKVSAGTWKRGDLKESGWSGFDQVVSSGSGFYYGRIATTGAMYWYKDANISDGNGDDIAYHNDDPVDTSGWTQSLLSAAPGQVTCTTPEDTVDRDDIGEVKAAGRDLMNKHDRDWATTAQWTCLDSLWTRESGWRWNAQNPTSAAYGIPQANPGSKMASAGGDWRTNPLTQIHWGLDYIDDRYGTPCSAWSHSQSTGWY